MREMLSLYFRKKGFTVTTALTGDEAKELLTKNSYSLAILDIGLGAENGLELLSFFKSKYPALPVIMFTGLEKEPDLLEKSLAMGANGFMRKTESLDALWAEVGRHMRKPAI
jgi:DNA-binding response OmpR family regulator